jgi:hypothetical protein
MMSEALARQYEEDRYRSFIHTQTHPRAIAAQAQLFGFDRSVGGKLRVLEIGCNDGSNLLSMASTLPGAHFLGIDLIESQIEKAQKSARKQDLQNVRFQTVDLDNFDPGDLSFDFIIAHGFFSWVPKAIQLKLLELCGQYLSEDGVALISYNVLPGASVQEALRQLFTLEIMTAEQGGDRLSESQKLAVFQDLSGFFEKASAAIPQTAKHWPHLRHGFERLKKKSNILIHDEGGEFWEAFYLLEFNQLIEEHGLTYLADVEINRDWVHAYPQPVREAMAERNMPRMKALQYSDFIFDTNFRTSLICREQHEANIRSEPDLDRISSFSMMPLAAYENLKKINPVVADCIRGNFAQRIGAPLAVTTISSLCLPDLSVEKTHLEVLKAQMHKALILWAN